MKNPLQWPKRAGARLTARPRRCQRCLDALRSECSVRESLLPRVCSGLAVTSRFLFPAKTVRTLRAVAHELELAGDQTSNPDLGQLLVKAETDLSEAQSCQAGGSVRPQTTPSPETISLNLGCGPSPVILEIVSSGPGSQIASREVTLAHAPSSDRGDQSRASRDDLACPQGFRAA